MNRRGLLTGFGALALAGCATTARQAKPRGEPSELEPLYAVTAGREGLVVRAASNGCTRKEDFAFYVDRTRDLPTLLFGRRRLDTCKSFAAGHADLVFSWSELGLAPAAPFSLLNPLTAFPGP